MSQARRREICEIGVIASTPAPTPDPIFADPRLAAVYDVLEAPRDDLDHYEAIVDEFGARSVLDVGCGTGELATRLARRGIDVMGVDPAEASLDIARGKPGAEAVTWVHGDVARSLPPAAVDLAVMTGNVAQVFLTDEHWDASLHAVRRALAPDGLLVFETRDPAQRAWEAWRAELTRRSAILDDGETVTSTTDVTEVRMPFVTFVTTITFGSDDTELTSETTLRFRSRSEVEASLDDAGFELIDVRDAPDRQGGEFVFLARRTV